MPSFLEDVRAALQDRYPVERQIGVGGMATVFLAQDPRHTRPVAIKVLQPDLAAALGGERFLKEIAIAANLTHPHILPLYDSGEAGGFLYYVMPFLDGESLRERINREKQLGVEDSLKITGEIADALNYAHSAGVVHRDIKPENIMFEGSHAVVTDFGIARAVTEAGEQRLTQTGIAIGTPVYMSPEQAAGASDLDGRSDIYALGCLLYEMLSGQPPFTGATVESIIHQHLSADVPSITVVRPNVPDQVVLAIQRALQKTPADRFPTAADFGKALELAVAQARISSNISLSAQLGSTAAPPSTRRMIRPWGRILGGLALGAVAVAAGAGLMRVLSPSSTVSDVPRLTVLPFTNRGVPQDEYFADGITDEVTARLAGVTGLTLIGRQSAAEYKNTSQQPADIGQELGVDYVLQGSVAWQRSGTGQSRVRVTPYLHKTEDGSIPWSAVYDEELTQVFDVQTQIATNVVNELDVALLAPERSTIEEQPTGNLEAYDFYLQGNGYLRRPINEQNSRLAQGMYERALANDSMFALAAARLAIVHARMYWYYFDRTPERVAMAEEAIDRALDLAPDDPDVRFARGLLHYRLSLDYDKALAEFAVVQNQRPNDSEVLQSIGTVERRQGRWKEAAEHIAAAAALEPRSASDAVQAGITYLYLRDYPAAQRHFDRATTLAPEQSRPRVWAARLFIGWQGDTAKARTLFRSPEMASPRELDPQTWWHWAVFRSLDGATPANFQRLQRLAKTDKADSAFALAAAAELHGIAGHAQLSRSYYDSTRMVLEALVAEQPEEPRFHSELGIAYAGLGRTDEAIRQAQRAIALMPISKEALIGTDWVKNLAQIYVMLDMQDEAVAQLQHVLSIPSGLSAHWLRVDPIWSPLRGHPSFRQLARTS